MTTLPTEPRVNTLETMTPDRLRAVVYGVPGAGKTTLACSWYPGTALVIDTEGGTRFLPGNHFIVTPKNYSEFVAIVNDLVSGNHTYRTVVIDSIDNLLRMIDAEAGQRGGKVAAGLVEFGKGLADRDGSLMRELRKLTLGTDLGLILVAHAKARDIHLEGEKDPIEVLGPRIDPNNRITGEIEGLLDYVLHVTPDHRIVTGGASNIVTKRRVPLPDILPADAGALFAAIQAGTEQILAQPVAA